MRIGHNRRRIGVDQDDFIALFPQSQTSLGAGIIEFRSLTDHDRTGTDHQDLFDIRSFSHGAAPFLVVPYHR
ncbi:hypothetical protein SDC9_110721 [bioreactor metagenome]|uniref:Uncharacterized protein n=1 Tax=bioreactor metagenome TaxID=1076179 RepID=A0A645BES9_9ZZZZ